MANVRKFQGSQLKAVIVLLAAYGLTLTQKILGAKSNTKLAKTKRPARHFPQPVSVSLPTLGTIAREAGLEFKRGKANPIKGKAQEKYVVRLVRDYGSLRAAEYLASDERNMKLFPEPISVSHVTLQKIAKAYGFKRGRGQRALKEAA